MGERALTALAFAALFVFCVIGQADDTDNPAWRRYDEGPLTADDFRGRPPRDRQALGGVVLKATTVTELRNRFRYQSTKRGETSVATLDSIEFFAVVLRDQSWNAAATDRRLLDHEQGHFDLSQIQALRTQQQFDRLLADDGMRGEGANAAAAYDDLIDQIKRAVAAQVKALQEAHREYDQQTRHGSDARSQAQHRRTQRELLSVLQRAQDRR